MAIYFSRPTTSLNTYESYEQLSEASPELWAAIPEPGKIDRDIDALDFCLLTASHPYFEEIFKSDLIIRIWVRAFSRLDLDHAGLGFEHLKGSQNTPNVQNLTARGLFQGNESELESQSDWPYKQQSCMSLAKRAISLLSSEEETPPELTALVKVCRASNLFFRRPSPYLALLYRAMPSVENLHPFQWTPTSRDQIPVGPPSSSGKNRSSNQDWPKNYCGSWDHFLSIVRGILVHANVSLEKHNGIREKLSFIQWCSRLDWNYIGESLRGFGRGIESAFKKNSVSNDCFSAYFSQTEFSSELGLDEKPLIDPNNSSSILHLIQSGVDPFAVFDTSEIVTGKPTQWTPGASSPHYTTLFHLACQFGTEEIVSALMADPELLREYYKTPQAAQSPTPYESACLNRRNPSVLIPLLKAAAQHPDEPLAQEIARFDAKSFQFPFLPPFLARLSGDRPWRTHPENRLILAAVSGDLKLARYLVEKGENEARERCGPQATELERSEAASAAASALVNRKGDRFAPGGTPVEVAIDFNQQEMAQYFFEKGAVANLEMQMKAIRQVNTMVKQILTDWKEEKEKILLELQKYDLEESQRQLKQISALAVAYGQNISDQEENNKKCISIIEENHNKLIQIQKGLERIQADRMKAIIEQIRNNYTERVSKFGIRPL